MTISSNPVDIVTADTIDSQAHNDDLNLLHTFDHWVLAHIWPRVLTHLTTESWHTFDSPVLTHPWPHAFNTPLLSQRNLWWRRWHPMWALWRGIPWSCGARPQACLPTGCAGPRMEDRCPPTLFPETTCSREYQDCWHFQAQYTSEEGSCSERS